jgi:hypothetical protein
MATTYKPGEIAPQSGTVQCSQHPAIKDKVEAGKKFPPADHWGQSGNPGCTWQYV